VWVPYILDLPASCTFSTALVISAFKASVSSADTEAAAGTTVNTKSTNTSPFNPHVSVIVHSRPVGWLQQLSHIDVFSDPSAVRPRWQPEPRLPWWRCPLWWRWRCWSRCRRWTPPRSRRPPRPRCRRPSLAASCRPCLGGPSSRGSAGCPPGWSLCRTYRTGKASPLERAGGREIITRRMSPPFHHHSVTASEIHQGKGQNCPLRNIM